MDVVILMATALALLWKGRNLTLTSHHHPTLKPPIQSAIIIAITLSHHQSPVTPVCPASCTRTGVRERYLEGSRTSQLMEKEA